MFYPKLRQISSNSVLDISSIQETQNRRQFASPHYSYNRNQAPSHSYLSHHHHQLCHSYSNDSLEREVFENTKQKCSQLFQETHFKQVLNRIQHSLQPIVDQLRQQIENKRYLSHQDRLVCMKSCATFLIETLVSEQWDVRNEFKELLELQHILNRCLSKSQKHISTQTETSVEIDLNKLKIADSVRVSFAPKDERPIYSVDELTRQKTLHRSVSRVFRKLNSDLQKIHHEVPFKAHLSKYHKHNHH